MADVRYAAHSPLDCAVRSACPRCGKGHLFEGFLTVAPRCDVCDLDFSFADPADGPAFFVMMTVAFPITALGIWIELAYDPPLWVHAVTTLPALLVGCILPLRFFKGWLVASQYIHKAEEGRLAKPATGAGSRPPNV
ncbi:DUF983 domain-containing protein [Methylobacterium oxalidis]|uniref:Membrane protein n=1 Tax=Methylobacterium oxalidis TaxID=944322 RepID=A0A512J6N2_9HYPH|nr:DUF983 domain-containing protein [Methylobacterium oxalidis]GEP05631.1 membrane protein [Methylobacterium oxalidis]GJE35481.1 hypothetical protein LDDCCGHA_5699 [Methylobacterium oxalidis]GLS65389.1 membrane protein [Methylobacterium oxalidis]